MKICSVLFGATVILLIVGATGQSGKHTNLTAHRNYGQINTPLCGVKAGSGSSKLFSVPWMALLMYNTTRGPVIFGCGGTLISDRYILTAVYCVKNLPADKKLVSVRLGEYDYSTEIDCEEIDGKKICADPPKNYQIEKILTHKNYSQKSYRNDIAMLKLKKPVNFTDSVRPICLPVSESERNRWFHNGELLTVVGWAASITGLQSSVVRTTHVEYVPLDECQAAYANLTDRIQIGTSQLCGRGTAQGDSTAGDGGGPLVSGGFQVEKRVVQYGVVSFGPSSGVRDPPGVYTKVGHYMKWILDNMGKARA